MNAQVLGLISNLFPFPPAASQISILEYLLSFLSRKQETT